MVGRDEGPDAGDTISDEALVERARRGDQECTRLLVRRYQRRIIGLAWGVGDARARTRTPRR